MIRQRLEWCEEHRGKTEEDWMKVLYSEESKFVQIRNNSRMVRRPPKTRFDPCFTVKTVLSWPGNSPHLNPIENLWDIIKDKVQEKEPNSFNDLC